MSPAYSSLSVSFTAVFSVFTVMGAGFVLRRLRILTKESDQGLLRITVNFLMPCLILNWLLFTDVFADRRNLYYPPIYGFLGIALGILFSWCAARILPGRWTALDTAKKRGSFATCVGMVNYGFVPIALVPTLFLENGAATMAVLFVANLGVEFAMWTVGLQMIEGKFDWHSAKRSLNGPTLTILIAIPLNLWVYGPYFPQSLGNVLPYFAFLKGAISMAGSAAIPMSIILVGATIGDVFRMDRYHHHLGFSQAIRIAFWSCLLRTALLPSLMMLLAVYAPFSLELKRVIVLHAAMGSAVFPIVLAQYYNGDPETALDAVLSNSALSLLTIPFWIAFGLHWIGG